MKVTRTRYGLCSYESVRSSPENCLMKQRTDVNNASKMAKLRGSKCVQILLLRIYQMRQSVIIDGRRLKSISGTTKKTPDCRTLKTSRNLKKKCTNRQESISRKRNNRVNDYMFKTAQIIIKYCLKNNIDTLLCGY